MSTEFICLVGPGQVDYTSVPLWEAATQCEYDSSATKVFGGTRFGVVNDNASVSGNVSNAVGTVVHCTATQILIKNISGVFQSEEQIEVDGSNYFTTYDVGDSAICICEGATTGDIDLYSSSIIINGSSDNDSSYRELRAANGHEALLSGWDESRYRIAFSGIGYYYLQCLETRNKIRNLQVELTGPDNNSNQLMCIYLGGVSGEYIVDACRLRSTLSGTIDEEYGIFAARNATITDCIAEGFKHATTCIGFRGGSYNSAIVNFYNCVAYDCGEGIAEDHDATVTAKNCASFNNADDFADVTTIDYCASDDNDGNHSVQPSGWETVFEDYANGDFRLRSTDTDLRGSGIGPDLDSIVSVADMEGDVRNGITCDIGADEYQSAQAGVMFMLF